MTQSGMMFCDYEGVMCIGANAYVNRLISDYETLAWCTFAAGIAVGYLLLNMFYKLKRIRNEKKNKLQEIKKFGIRKDM